VVLQLVLLFCVALAGLVGPAWDGPARLVGLAAGVALSVGGLALAVRGAVDLRANLTPLPHPRDDATLVDGGIYSLARHPIYGGIIVAAVGWGLASASIAALVLAGATAVFFTLKSTREESWLLEQFPGYAAYRDRTHRFIPWLC
jgi:protein-S-isoprenylcysteine O-methyltransferase Ste14